MKRVDPEVMKQLWSKVESQIEQNLNLLCVAPGVKRERGRAKNETLVVALREMFQIVYTEAVNLGYDMGHSVFGGE